MGLRLRFTLSARGGSVRSDASAALEVFRYLRRGGLIDERSAQCSILSADGIPDAARDAWAAPHEVEWKIERAARDGARVITLSGLRTTDRFPNPFHEYTIDEPTLAAFIRIRFVCGATPAAQGFEMEFTEVDFLADTPRIPIDALMRALQERVGAPLSMGCYQEEMAETE